MYLRGTYQKVVTDKINSCDSVSSRWKKSYNWGSSGFDLGVHYFFLIILVIYPKITDHDAKVVLFAYDTNIAVTNFNQGGLQTALNKALCDITSWFKANFLSPSCNMTYYLQF